MMNQGSAHKTKYRNTKTANKPFLFNSNLLLLRNHMTIININKQHSGTKKLKNHFYINALLIDTGTLCEHGKTHPLARFLSSFFTEHLRDRCVYNNNVTPNREVRSECLIVQASESDSEHEWRNILAVNVLCQSCND